MIDVSKYMQQLEELRSRLLWQIDGFYIDVNNIPVMGIKEMMRLYFETGIMWLNK